MTARARMIRAAVRFAFWLAVILLGAALIGWLQSWVGFYAWCLAMGLLIALVAIAAWAHIVLSDDN